MAIILLLFPNDSLHWLYLNDSTSWYNTFYNYLYYDEEGRENNYIKLNPKRLNLRPGIVIRITSTPVFYGIVLTDELERPRHYKLEHNE